MNTSSTEERDRKDRKLLKESGKRFLHELNKQLPRLEQLLLSDSPRLDDARTIYRMAHALKGSAPIFGFARIGVVAEKLSHLWEWSCEAAVSDELTSRQFAASQTAGRGFVLELGMEKELYERELELDGTMPGALCAHEGSRLLVIDDDHTLRGYLTGRLRVDGYTVDEASDVESAKKLLYERTYDLISLDLMMHPQSGYELFAFLKEDPTLKWVPLIVLSGRDDVRDKVRCFHLGADDFVTKPFQYEELHARIFSLLKRTKSFEQMAFRDPLTGVHNRRYFDHQVQVELQRVRRYPAPISIVFIDIDRFKAINDTYGHHIGDLVLQGLAHLLQEGLRATDLLARFGGEEFVIVLPNTDGAGAVKAIETMLLRARQGPIVQYEGQAYHITFSAGVAVWEDPLTLDRWIQQADAAMYSAKLQGRNRVVLYEAQTDEEEPKQNKIVFRKKIVIADDDPILRSILAARLQHLNADIVEAANGAEAYRAITASPGADLCILDGMMPELDGFGLLEQLRGERSNHRRTKVLMLSGRSREDDVVKGLQLGADDYMVKPFSLVELEMRAKRLLEG